MQTATVLPEAPINLQQLISVGITRGLIVDDPWISYLLDGSKVWEMRTRASHIRGRIALIRRGTGLIVGTIELVDSLDKQSNESMQKHSDKHRIPLDQLEELKKWRYPWVMKEPETFVEPIPYTHPRGAVIWVDFQKLLEQQT